jgi:hypothetical protein
VAWLTLLAAPALHAQPLEPRVPQRPESVAETPAWRALKQWSFEGAIRGITVGPIENQRHPGHGYGSAPCARTMREIRRMGGNWVSLTPFGRVADLHPSGVAMSFEAPFSQNKDAVAAAVKQAHAAGLRVMLVPHLWVESGEWRGFIDPGDDAAWQKWARAYDTFVTNWARVAERTQVDLLAVGIELRRWVTTERASSFAPIIKHVRTVYKGPLTYAANWDDVEDTVIWGDLDFIGINAFYPLAEHQGASLDEMARTAGQRTARANELGRRWNKAVVFTEFGYTSRKDAALRPWEWPEALSEVVIDQVSQAEAYRALLGASVDQPWLAGLFVWRLYADLDDVTQEPEFGFSFRGKLAERELRDAFATCWAADRPRPLDGTLTSSGFLSHCGSW